MRTSRLSILLIAASAVHADPVIATSKSWSGIQIFFEAKLEPPPAPGTNPEIVKQLERDVPGGVFCDAGVHRFWKDAEQKAYLGYDVSVEPGRSSKTFQVRITPLTLNPQNLAEFEFPENWTRLSLPKYPVIPELHVGDTVVIDLMVNPTTGQKLVDHLTLQSTSQPMPMGPNDFVPDTTLSLRDPRISINGKLVEATAHIRGGINGMVVWFYLQGQGRFVLSLTPSAEFHLRKAGEVSENVLTIRDGPDTYRIECSGRIAPSSGNYNVYLYRDREWRPAGGEANATFRFGSASLAALIPK